MAPIALSNKKILACRDLYFIDSHQSNLAGYVIGTIISLPRNGRTSYLVQWDLKTSSRQNQVRLIRAISKEIVKNHENTFTEMAELIISDV